MRVNFYATLRDVAGQKTVDLDIPDYATVRQLVEAVVTRFPPMREILLQQNGDLYGHVHVFINGRDAPFLADQLETVIKPTDTINIFPAVGGG
jgi:molybdopterin synthase sulfur carrier subunit